MKIPSKIKTAILAGAISAAPLAKSNAQETSQNIDNKNKIEAVDENTNNNKSKIVITKNPDANTINDNIIEVKDTEKGFHFSKRQANYTTYANRVKRIFAKKIKDLTGDNTEADKEELLRQEKEKLKETKKDIRNKNKANKKSATQDKRTYKKQQRNAEKMFKEGSFLDNLIENNYKKSKKIGLNVDYEDLSADNKGGYYNSSGNSVTISNSEEAKKYSKGIIIHEDMHHLNEASIPNEFEQLLNPRCRVMRNVIDESFAGASSGACSQLELHNDKLEDFTKKDFEATIGKNIALFEHDPNDKNAKDYRNNQFKKIIESSTENAEDLRKLGVVGIETGVADIKSEDYKYYCIKEFSKIYGLDHKNIMKEYEKSRDQYVKEGKGNLIDAATGFSTQDEEKYISQIKGEHKKYQNGEVSDTLTYYMHPDVEKNISELKNFKENDIKNLNNKGEIPKSNNINAPETKTSELFEIKYADEDKNAEYLKDKPIRDKNILKIKEEAKIKKNNIIPNGSKKEKLSKRKGRLNHFKQSGTVKDYGKSDKTTQKQPVVQQYNNNSLNDR